MTKNNKTAITVETAIKSPIEKVWKLSNKINPNFREKDINITLQ